MNNKISIIISAFNEEKVLANCLGSLSRQTIKDLEIIVVDDGSTDGSRKFATLSQNHQGPGAARNLGANKATGEILVFVDADMEFAPEFIEKLTKPIIENKTIGTFSKEEYLLNKNIPLARCWNLNLGRKFDQMIPSSYPDKSPVYRAILKSKFNEVGGFDTKIGYTDDWTISRKLRVEATVAKGAIFYHRNPETLSEIWTQARWFGKNEFLTGSTVRKLYNLIRYFPLIAVFKGIVGIVRQREMQFLPFKIVFDAAVFTSILLSFFKEQKNK